MSDDQSQDATSGSSLNEMLCFNLYAAARATSRLYSTLLASWDLTYPQYLVLKLLWSRGSATVGDIAKGLMLDSGTTTPLVRRLETRGLLQRTRSSKDERIVTVSLTARGRALEAEMTDLTTDIARATGLETTEAEATIAALQNINRNLVDVLAATPKGSGR